MASPYHTRWIALAQLDEALKRRMSELYLQAYDGTTRELFLNDLGSKDGALMLYCDRELVGFSVLQFYDHHWQGRPHRIVYSGDTVVHRDHWRQYTLATDWIALMGQLKRQRPEVPLMWFLLVKGHRTFLYLPVFAHSYWPHPQQDRSDLKMLADLLAAERFPEHYNPHTGVVEFATSRGHLKPELADPADYQEGRPEVDFFFERNPGYRRGHELVCLCEIDEKNMKPLARRAFLQPREEPFCISL